jgi:hypothetical protein
MREDVPNTVSLSARFVRGQATRLCFVDAVRLDVSAGVAWITTSGRREDFVREAGSSLELGAGEVAYVSALTDACVRIVPRRPPLPEDGWLAGLRRIGRWIAHPARQVPVA